MNIATMVAGYIPAPRPVDMVYAPIDLAVAITERLNERGHTMTYFGPNGSHLCGPVETLNMRPLVHNQAEWAAMLSDIDTLARETPGMWNHFFAREMFERARAGEFDLLHFHQPEVALPYVKLYPDVPVVYTLHDPTTINNRRETLEMYQTSSQFYISISNNQRIPAPDLPYVATVYNGVNLELFSYDEEEGPDDYLLFAGRIVPEKGVKEAIQVAEATGKRLLIIGLLYADNQDYFDQYIKPHLNERILYIGFVEHEQLVRYYQKAEALLMPIQWEEPFGLTMIEAMSCGTPVIALRRGSVEEVLVDKKTGYIVDSIAEMIDAVGKVSKIKRSACRKHVEQHFSLKTMVDGYEAAYQKALDTFQKQQSCIAQKEGTCVAAESTTTPISKAVAQKEHSRATKKLA
ncbi:MAG TPA: glycosyltransferase family 4 protein [Candidatus Saccharimonadales bacterium]|jgi:glycosyltransferase involved in cell wall biosynthesis|nr:glycosyltransferase family 4 protein [Candidatus Saccharimonadales bacterium]